MLGCGVGAGNLSNADWDLYHCDGTFGGPDCNSAEERLHLAWGVVMPVILVLIKAGNGCVEESYLVFVRIVSGLVYGHSRWGDGIRLGCSGVGHCSSSL